MSSQVASEVERGEKLAHEAGRQEPTTEYRRWLSNRGLSIRDKARLMDAVNAVPALASPQRRNILEQLRAEFGNDAFNPTQFGSLDNWTIVDTCIKLDAMSELVSVLKIVGGESQEWRRLEQIVMELVPSPPLIDDDIDTRIRELLTPIDTDSLSTVLRHEKFQAYLPILPSNPVETTAVYVRLSSYPDLFPLLNFLEILGHQLEDNYAVVEIHRMIDDLALRAGFTTQLRELCRSLRDATGSPASLVETPTLASPTKGPQANDDNPGGDVRSPGVKSDRAEGVRVPPQVWGGTPPRNSNFTGRTELLEQIHDALSQHTQSALVPQPLHGLGGIGKSQVAVEFAYIQQYEYELVWWIQADDEQSIRRSLTSLARRLNLADSDDVQEIVDRALDALRRGDPYRRWLLIYDNAPEPSVVQPYLPTGPGHVLVTSRSRSWSGTPNAIEIDVFAPEESIELIRKGWPDLSDERALALADKLGHLPLALEQAVAVHGQTGMPLADYLRALENSPKVILDEGTPVNYPHSVAAALELAHSSIKETSPAAAYLLELCSFLSSHPISIPMLARGRSAQPMAELRDDILLRRAVRDLGRYALVQLDSGRDFIRVHALIRAVLRDSIPPEKRDAVQDAALAILAAANPGTPDEPETWTQHAHIAPHVLPAGLLLSEDNGVRRVVLDQIRYNFAIGDYSTSRDLGEQTVKSWRARFGMDDELTLVACRHLSISLRLLGRYDEARKLNQDTLNRMRVAFGADHEHTLATASSVGADLRLAGDFHDALELDTETLNRHRQVLGPDDPATLRALNNLGVDYRMLGNFRKAMELDEENIELKKRIYGEDHPRTLLSYSCLARDLYGLGQYQRGLALASEKMPIHEKKLPPNHGELLVAQRNMAVLMRKAGHNNEALDYTRELFNACRRTFGRKHEHTLSAMVTLSNAHRVNGDAATALTFGQDALAEYREVLGARHALTLGCQVNVAIVLRLLGRNEEAQVVNDEALNLLTITQGEKHPYTLCAANTKANGLAASGHVEEAKSLGAQTLEFSRLVRGEHHPYTLACAANLSFDLEKLGDLVQANQLRRETLDQLGVQLGTDHPETMNAGVYRRMESDVEVPAT